MAKYIKTGMMVRYMIKLGIRVAIFLTVFVVYIIDRITLEEFMTYDIAYGITPLSILWLIFMVMMIRHLIPPRLLTMAQRKSRDDEFVIVPGYSELELHRFVHEQNIKAWQVMLVWLIMNGIWGLLYLMKIVDTWDLIMLTVFYFLCDYICILFFCPFQTFIMKNKCCVNCRIYDWGHFMMFTPLLFIKNFFSWSLFFTAAVVLIHWEITYAKHPERFWSGSNKRLQCDCCGDKICGIKKWNNRTFFSWVDKDKDVLFR